MGDFNKIISFILGFIVVVVFLAVITGKLNFRKQLTSSSKITVTTTLTPSKSPTPTSTQKNSSIFGFLQRKPTLTPTTAPKTTVVKGQVTNYQTNQPVIVVTSAPLITPVLITSNSNTVNQQVISNIPNTGVPTAFIPFVLSSLGMGIFLRKKK